MKALLAHLRTHRRQRRLLTAAVALTAGLLAAVLGYPLIREYLTIHRLGSEDPRVRARAVARATELASDSPRMVRRLEAALETDDDEQFLAVAQVLRNLRQFYTDGRQPEAIDRLRALRLSEPLPPDAEQVRIEGRVLLLMRIIAEGRDNVHVRRILSAVAGSRFPQLRVPAAMLAGRLGDCETLGRLLEDDDSAVRMAAALSAAAGRCTTLAEKLADILRSDGEAEVAAAGGYALAVLDAPAASEPVISRLLETDNAELRDPLLLTAPLLAGGDSAVAELIERSQTDGGFAAAPMLLAAARMELASAAPAARDVLAAAAEGSAKVTESQVLAAMEVARAMDIDVREELNAYCRRYWSARLSVSMAAAARLLAAQTAARNDGGKVREIIDTLLRAAEYDRYVQATDDSRETSARGTPRASAEAAAGLWMLDAAQAESLVRRITGDENPQAGDTLAWRLAEIDPERAFELGLAMLPEAGAPPERRIYNDNERACGAMLLALSARSHEQQRLARSRIRQRLDHINEPFAVRASLRCALAALGDEQSAAAVREFLSADAVPRPRALTALLSAGDKNALDWLFWNPSVDDGEVLGLLIDEGLAEVLAATAAELPRVPAAAGAGLRTWQLQILRVHYAINCHGLKVGLNR
ncbi:MAG: hypothetical protein ACP5HU_05540 [Phycisphaerae bacterium]